MGGGHGIGLGECSGMGMRSNGREPTKRRMAVGARLGNRAPTRRHMPWQATRQVSRLSPEARGPAGDAGAREARRRRGTRTRAGPARHNRRRPSARPGLCRPLRHRAHIRPLRTLRGDPRTQWRRRPRRKLARSTMRRCKAEAHGTPCRRPPRTHLRCSGRAATATAARRTASTATRRRSAGFWGFVQARGQAAAPGGAATLAGHAPASIHAESIPTAIGVAHVKEP